jgi:hypothetical protein
MKINRTITNSRYQVEFSVAKRTASLDLAELVGAGIIQKSGKTGKGGYYQLTKGAKEAMILFDKWQQYMEENKCV